MMSTTSLKMSLKSLSQRHPKRLLLQQRKRFCRRKTQSSLKEQPRRSMQNSWMAILLRLSLDNRKSRQSRKTKVAIPLLLSTQPSRPKPLLICLKICQSTWCLKRSPLLLSRLPCKVHLRRPPLFRQLMRLQPEKLGPAW